MIGTAVFAKLSSTTAITNLVNNRIYPDLNKERSSFPQIVYDCKDALSTESFDSASNPYQVQLSILAVGTDYLIVDQIAKAVVTALDGVRGSWGSTTVVLSTLDSVNEDKVIEPESERIEYYLKELTFTVGYLI